jgi:serine/threonine protein phosphatase PrpC
MPFQTDSVSRAGGRQHNEDACSSLWVGNAGCWVVADGLGGHRGGETASNLAVQAVLTSFQSNPEFSAAALQRHLEAAQQAVLNAQKEEPRLAGMRTTIVVLMTDSRQTLWAHVGDSRLYCFDAGRVAFHTRDHSVVQAMVSAGDLSPEQIRHHPDRNRLLRALGNADGGFRPEIPAQPRSLYRGTTFLLCTDGFWENVKEGEMEIDLAKAEGPRDWLGKMGTRLLERITEESDNYTALAVFFDSESAPRAPAPKPLEDEEMNSRLDQRWETTAILAGVVLIALVAAALGGWNWLAIRQLNQRADNQDKSLSDVRARTLSAPQIAELNTDLASVERVCNDPKFRDLCTSKAAAINPAPAQPDTAESNAANGAKQPSTKKGKKSKKT